MRKIEARLRQGERDNSCVATAGREGAAPRAFVARLLPGRTYDEAKSRILKPSGPPPVEEEAKMLGVHALSPGVANDVELELAEGDYVIVCYIAEHHMMGRVRQLTLTR